MKHPSDSSYSPDKLISQAETLASKLPYTYGRVIVLIVWLYNCDKGRNITNSEYAVKVIGEIRRNINKILATTIKSLT